MTRDRALLKLVSEYTEQEKAFYGPHSIEPVVRSRLPFHLILVILLPSISLDYSTFL